MDGGHVEDADGEDLQEKNGTTRTSGVVRGDTEGHTQQAHQSQRKRPALSTGTGEDDKPRSPKISNPVDGVKGTRSRRWVRLLGTRDPALEVTLSVQFLGWLARRTSLHGRKWKWKWK